MASLLKINLRDFYEGLAICGGLGLSAFALFTALLPLLRLPLDWRIILILSLAYPLYYLAGNMGKIADFLDSKKLRKSIRPSLYIILLFLIFGFTFFMYHNGAFSYPYLEDDDPWDHAIAAKYIATEKTVYEPIEGKQILIYLDARGPAYDGIMAVLHQTSPSLAWTMKFFNALIISFGIFFFFYLAKEFFHNSSNKAIWATFFLAMFPTYLTHFIWTHSMALTLIIFSFYTLFTFTKSWKDIPAAIIPAAAILITSESDGMKFGLFFFLFFLAKSISEKKIDWKSFAAGTGGFILSGIVWWFPMLVKYGGLYGLYKKGLEIGIVDTSNVFIHPSIQGIWRVGVLGSATRQHGIYTLGDIFFAKGQNMINVPIGVGFVLACLVVLGALYFLIKNKKILKNTNETILFFWIAVAFFGIHGGTRWWSPVAFYTFRVWLFFSIFASLLAVYGLYFVFSAAKSFKIPVIIIILLAVSGVWFTSGSQKYELNTAQWPPGGGWTSVEELKGYLWLGTLPVNTPVFEAGGWGYTIGMDKFTCRWCEDEIPYYEELYKYENDEIYSFLKRKGYSYLVISGKAFGFWGENETNTIIASLNEDFRFKQAFTTPHFFSYAVE